MVKVKICGITDLEDAVWASSAGADALGFIFTSRSPRFIKPDEAKKIIERLDPFVFKTGVFLDEDSQKVSDIAFALGLNGLQFHGRESADYCEIFSKDFKVIKVIFPTDEPLARQVKRYRCDAFLFDVPLKEKQAGVKGLPPEALKEISDLIKSGIRCIISGGLNCKNVNKALKFSPYAVDVSGGVEKMVGKKDKDLVREFIEKAKAKGVAAQS
jgi:phosphoribosylanthranilate isomerase